MSRNKFQSLLKYIQFDHKNSRPIRPITDKFAAIRELWNLVMDNCQKLYFSYADLTVDEQLFSYQLRLVCIYHKRFIIVLRVSLFKLIFYETKLKYPKSIFIQMTVFI